MKYFTFGDKDEFRNLPEVVYLEVEHNNCWTYLTYKTNLKIRLINQDFDFNIPFFTSYILGKSNYSSDIKEFIKKIKHNESVNDILKLYTEDNIFSINLSLLKKGSISNIIRNNNGIIMNHEIVDGIETWYILVDEKNIPSLRDDIENNDSSVLLKFKILEKEKILNNILNSLTPSEALSLYLALDNGFLDFPHKVSTRDLAKIMGVSSATFVTHLRRAIKKIVLKNYYEFISHKE
ncbi:hypothetical protein DFR86_04315 [Acidianus sulfidivorans JP7]|uniref:HTH bat-type domain-containing protein n=1 Tax=Acidianus sulfidivorans JP7 TaxID=619593 RepID=A0A2U9ILG7_9CREN|nr:helix-turn-helix domain-containing protein [Acidianus sulfidivorans]AWR96857.1 hypothetical protein DFR86_04315 [Acidianus sulfidivorans JP7]